MTYEDESRAYVAAAVREAFPDKGDEFATGAAVAIEPLWTFLADQGMTDSFGCMESTRVIPATLFYLLSQSNPMNPAYHNYTGETA